MRSFPRRRGTNDPRNPDRGDLRRGGAGSSAKRGEARSGAAAERIREQERRPPARRLRARGGARQPARGRGDRGRARSGEAHAGRRQERRSHGRARGRGPGEPGHRRGPWHLRVIAGGEGERSLGEVSRALRRGDRRQQGALPARIQAPVRAPVARRAARERADALGGRGAAERQAAHARARGHPLGEDVTRQGVRRGRQGLHRQDSPAPDRVADRDGRVVRSEQQGLQARAGASEGHERRRGPGRCPPARLHHHARPVREDGPVPQADLVRRARPGARSARAAQGLRRLRHLRRLVERRDGPQRADRGIREEVQRQVQAVAGLV